MELEVSVILVELAKLLGGVLFVEDHRGEDFDTKGLVLKDIGVFGSWSPFLGLPPGILCVSENGSVVLVDLLSDRFFACCVQFIDTRGVYYVSERFKFIACIDE